MDDLYWGLIVLMGGLYTTYLVMTSYLKEQHTRISSILGDAHETYRLIGEFKKSVDIPWLLIWRTHNGGGRPKRRSRIKISVDLESAGEGFSSVFSKYQNLPVDEQTVDLLSQIASVGSVGAFVEDMGEGLLSEICRNNGCSWVYFSQIGESTDAVYFLMLGTKSRETPFTTNKGSEVNVLEARLQKKYRRTKRHNLLYNFLTKTIK